MADFPPLPTITAPAQPIAPPPLPPITQVQPAAPPLPTADSPPDTGPSIELSVVLRAETTDAERSVLIDWSVTETAFRKAIADLLDARTRLLALAVGRSAIDVIPDGRAELEAELSATRASLTRLEEWLAHH